ncbi:hypothetical protein EVAR_47014_1 [Eumeta japonica]|uniref:Uncharacterized protein n=1 Tax=Eumeta variegata TaxID=151549 RepID=A0A4C1XJX6_EUMVA|nr:hypothetical protein EVAR_47014_1 [Eumeta japonica]
MYSRELASARQVEPVNQALGTVIFSGVYHKELARYLASRVPKSVRSRTGNILTLDDFRAISELRRPLIRIIIDFEGPVLQTRKFSSDLNRSYFEIRFMKIEFSTNVEALRSQKGRGRNVCVYIKTLTRFLFVLGRGHEFLMAFDRDTPNTKCTADPNMLHKRLFKVSKCANEVIRTTPRRGPSSRATSLFSRAQHNADAHDINSGRGLKREIRQECVPPSNVGRKQGDNGPAMPAPRAIS